jgi:DNA-binding NarL/FixJ family response regulator
MHTTHTAQPIGSPTQGGGNHLEPPSLPALLEPRERQLVRLVVEGCSTDEIASRLTIRPQTVKNRLSRIYAKLGVATRVQLAVYALRNGLADPV